MKSFVMIDKDEYDSHAHVPNREYEELVKKASEKDKPAYERALFVYDTLVKKLKNHTNVSPESLADFLEERRPYFVKDMEERFGIHDHL